MSVHISVSAATKAIADLCRERRHQPNNVNPVVADLCERCREAMSRIERLAMKEYKPLSTTMVHFVVGAQLGQQPVLSSLDEAQAHEVARENKSLVVSWPVSGDYREDPDRVD